jgi:hypothetical protein
MNLQAMCNKPMTLTQIQDISLVMAKTYVRQQKEREEGIKQASTLPTPEVPKLDKGNWCSVRDSFIELLSRQTGSNGVPLQYIVQEGAVGDYDLIYTTLDQKLIKCTNHLYLSKLILRGLKLIVQSRNLSILGMGGYAGKHSVFTLKVKAQRMSSEL